MIIDTLKKIYAYFFDEQYVVYKGSGGLFHNLRSLTQSINSAIWGRRKLIIDMREHSAFRLDFSTFFTLENMDFYEDYSILEQSEKFSTEEIKELKAARTTGIPAMKEKYKKGPLIVHCSAGEYIVHKKIKVNAEIMDKLRKETPVGEPYIALHFRNTDIQNDIFSFIEKVKKVRDEQNIHVLYLASDDFYAYDIVKEHLSDMKVIRKVVPMKDVKNIHYKTKDKYKQIYESLLDVYFIMKSDFFIPSINSSYSRGIMKMLDRKHYFFPDFSTKTVAVD
jgi:hypothetical protein